MHQRCQGLPLNVYLSRLPRLILSARVLAEATAARQEGQTKEEENHRAKVVTVEPRNQYKPNIASVPS